MLNVEKTKTRFDVIEDMTRLDGALVSSMEFARQLFHTAKCAVVLKRDEIVKGKAKILLEEANYLVHLIEMINNTYNYEIEADERKDNDPVTDPLDIN